MPKEERQIKNRYSGVVADAGCYNSLAELAVAKKANLNEADLSGANLRGANLNEANLRGADLRGADLSRANLSGANLRGANLSGANLSEADLSGANLSGADLSEAKQRIIRIHASRHEINAIGPNVRVGCIRKPISEWLECFAAVGKQHEYTSRQIEEYGMHLQHIARLVAIPWKERE